ncbi:MAG: DUF4232 domain-containing protein [Ilumatobacteraceae bacterium]
MLRSRLGVVTLLLLALAACSSDGLGQATVTLPPAGSDVASTDSGGATVGPGECSSANMGLRSDPPSTTSGSVYTPLLLTNNGSKACTLSTRLSVSFVDGDGQTVGPTPINSPGAGGTDVVSMAPGETRQTVLRYIEPESLQCRTYQRQTSVRLIINDTQPLNLPPADWPICIVPALDQVSLLDIGAPG